MRKLTCTQQKSEVFQIGPFRLLVRSQIWLGAIHVKAICVSLHRFMLQFHINLCQWMSEYSMFSAVWFRNVRAYSGVLFEFRRLKAMKGCLCLDRIILFLIIITIIGMMIYGHLRMVRKVTMMMI